MWKLNKKEEMILVLGTKFKKAVATVVMTGLLSLQVNAATATVKADVLNVRQAPTTASTVLGAVYSGEKIEVTDNDGEWATILFNNNTAYVAQQYIIMDEPTYEKRMVNASLLNIRSGSSVNHAVVGQASYGATVDLLETVDSEWSKISYNGITGYVASRYISSRATGNTTSRSGTRPWASDNSALIDYAKKYIGVPYVYGGTTPAGFDCSGYVQFVFSNFGVKLSRTTYTQVNEGVYVAKENLKMGDLVFFGTAGNVSHVGIYISDGNFIHASRPGDTVKINSLYSDYYTRNYYTARRVR